MHLLISFLKIFIFYKKNKISTSMKEFITFLLFKLYAKLKNLTNF